MDAGGGHPALARGRRAGALEPGALTPPALKGWGRRRFGAGVERALFCEQCAQLAWTSKRPASAAGCGPYRSELPEAYSDYIAFEDEARSISNYESLFVPGLLQTEAYARAQLRGTWPSATEEDIENRVAARMERQPVLHKDGAPKLWAIIDEAALRRLVGGREVMREQIGRLLEARSIPNVTTQVIPFGAGAHPGMDGSFVILDFPDGDDQRIVYIESGAGGLFLEEAAEINRYILMFEHLRAAASGLDATAALLSAISKEI